MQGKTWDKEDMWEEQVSWVKVDVKRLEFWLGILPIGGKRCAWSVAGEWFT